MIRRRIVKRTRNGFYTEEIKRLPIYFARVQSMRFEKTASELLAYQMPITRILESNSLKDVVQGGLDAPAHNAPVRNQPPPR